MKLLVCISLVPDTTTKISFINNDTQFNNDKVQWILNPYDEWYALVRALELKEANGGTVTVINVGPADNDVVIRKALAIGADDAIRVNLTGEADAFLIASEISHMAKEGKYDMIFLGKETISYNGSLVGGMLAELLDVPFISYASKLDINNNSATIERDIEGGKEILEVQTPFVVSCAKGMAEARIPNMKGIMSARTKPLNVVTARTTSSKTSVLKYQLTPSKSAVKMIPSDKPELLVELLHNEAKVL